MTTVKINVLLIHAHVTQDKDQLQSILLLHPSFTITTAAQKRRETGSDCLHSAEDSWSNPILISSHQAGLPLITDSANPGYRRKAAGKHFDFGQYVLCRAELYVVVVVAVAVSF